MTTETVHDKVTKLINRYGDDAIFRFLEAQVTIRKIMELDPTFTIDTQHKYLRAAIAIPLCDFAHAILKESVSVPTPTPVPTDINAAITNANVAGGI